MPTITDTEVGTEIATDGVLDSLVLTAVPTDYTNDYFCLADGERVIFNMHIASSPVSVGSNLMSGGTSDFTSLVVKSIPPGCTVDYELAMPPTLTSLSPDTAVAGSPDDIKMSCTGTGFTRGTTIKFGNYDEPTTFVSDTEITTGVRPILFVNPDTVPVTVHTGSLVSDPVDFTFTEPTVTE